jgi:hypothetical protein
MQQLEKSQQKGNMIALAIAVLLLLLIVLWTFVLN